MSQHGHEHDCHGHHGHGHSHDGLSDVPTGWKKVGLQVAANGTLMTIGLLYQDECPVEPNIPLCLLGEWGVILNLIFTSMQTGKFR